MSVAGRWPSRNGEDTTTGRARTAAGNRPAWRRWENGAALAHRGDFVGAEAGVHGAAGHLHEHQDIGFDLLAEAASGDGADVAGVIGRTPWRCTRLRTWSPVW